MLASGGSRGGSLGSIEPPFHTEVSGRLKQVVSKFLLCYFITTVINY